MEWCQALFVRAKMEEVRNTRARRDTVQPQQQRITPSKRKRMNNTQPKLPEYCLLPPQEDHHPVRAEGAPQLCVYCCYLKSLTKGAGGRPKEPSKSKFYCYACGDYLCKEHFDVFHEKDDENGDEPVAV